jgi:hypothetical protein
MKRMLRANIIKRMGPLIDFSRKARTRWGSIRERWEKSPGLQVYAMLASPPAGP